MSGALAALRDRPWIWSFLAAFAAWALSSAVAGQGAGSMLSGALSFGAFYVIVGLGQMAVVTLGPGNIDLSVPAGIALSGCVAMKLMNGVDAGMAPGIAAGLAAGLAVGLGNAALIFLLRIPPIIATLAASFVVQSIAIRIGGGLLVKPPPAIAAFSTAAPFGVPLLALVAVLLAVLAQWVLTRTILGRAILAIGQNRQAARLAGLPVTRVAVTTYAMSGLASALCGILLASFSGGASLDMGQEYLLASIAVVVIGGTAVAGGRACVAGVWGASLFLFLLVSMLNGFGFGAGGRTVLTGLIIIGVVAAASGGNRRGA